MAQLLFVDDRSERARILAVHTNVTITKSSPRLVAPPGSARRRQMVDDG
jgi:hypothetical protein